MRTGDYNRDGRPDIFSLNNAGRLSHPYVPGRADSTRLADSVSLQWRPFTAGAVESGDLNGDGVIDLAVAATNFVGAGF